MAVEFLSGAAASLNQLANSPGLKTGGPSAAGEGFGSAVKDAIESIDSTQKSAERQIADAVSGKSPDLHKTIIELQSAELKFQLGLQVRNKLIGAYEEIMRMQV